MRRVRWRSNRNGRLKREFRQQAIEEITVSINHIAENAKNAECLAEKTGEVSNHSVNAVQGLAAGMEKISGEVGKLATTLSSLGGTFWRDERDHLRTLCETAPGTVLSYAEIAAKCGRPGAVAAVSRILASNPFPLLIPCHRAAAAGDIKRFDVTDPATFAPKTWLGQQNSHKSPPGSDCTNSPSRHNRGKPFFCGSGYCRSTLIMSKIQTRKRIARHRVAQKTQCGFC